MNFVNSGKIQLVNGTWRYFYKCRMLDLKCGPRDRKPVSRETAESLNHDLIEDFTKETDSRLQQRMR